MKLNIKPYKKQIVEWPKTGHHIMAQYDNEKIIVYQSYRAEIGNFAVKNQYFGGAFSLNRMTWIKPNYLWMMYRNGWGTKEGQEIVLAIHLKIEAFERYVSKAIHSSYQEHLYTSIEDWKELVKKSSIRLQWDPDHDPYGTKLERKAIQIGIRNEQIKLFSKEDILKIEDISDFVSVEYEKVKNNKLEELLIPEEKPFLFSNEKLNQKLELNNE